MIPLPAAAEPLVLAVASAEAGVDAATGTPVVTIRMTAGSASAFGALTAANIGRIAELRIDGEAVTRPLIREAITGGVAQVSGSMTATDAADLARRLREGTARIEVEIVAE